MNWLAHLFLSDPSPGFRVGSLLPDLLKRNELAGLGGDFLSGIERHHTIDRFTDTHPIVRRSVRRFDPPYRRFGGILVDVFYDHILAREWESYASGSLADFTASVYDSFRACRGEIPPAAVPVLDRMSVEDWLGSYREQAGIATALTRLGARFRRPVELAGAVSVLGRSYDLFRQDFAEFFPELRSHVGKSITP